jgi:hypothetical protein
MLVIKLHLKNGGDTNSAKIRNQYLFKIEGKIQKYRVSNAF